MLSKTVAFAAAMLFLGHGMAKSVGNEITNVIRDTGAAEIATDPYYACNCPNNCDYTKGHDCKYYSGPSDTSPVISGHCEIVGSVLYCE